MARRGRWLEVANRSGVSYSWISKFMNGHIPNPGSRTLERLQAGIKGVKPTPKEASHA